jgi:hypothetical protein
MLLRATDCKFSTRVISTSFLLRSAMLLFGSVRVWQRAHSLDGKRDRLGNEGYRPVKQ